MKKYRKNVVKNTYYKFNKKKNVKHGNAKRLKNNSVTQEHSPLLVLYNIFLKNESYNVVRKKKNAKGGNPKRKK